MSYGAAGLTGYNAVQFQFNPLGDVAHSLNAAGAVQTQRLYDAYGNPLQSPVTSDPFGYRGQVGYYTDHEAGYIALAYRYYDPPTGRFLNRDPIGFRGGVNLYGYVGGGVVAEVDPRGLAGDGEPCGPTDPLSIAVNDHKQRFHDSSAGRLCALSTNLIGSVVVGGIVGAVLGGPVAGVVGGVAGCLLGVNLSDGFCNDWSNRYVADRLNSHEEFLRAVDCGYITNPGILDSRSGPGALPPSPQIAIIWW